MARPPRIEINQAAPSPMVPVDEEQAVVAFPPRPQTPFAYDADAIDWDTFTEAVSPNIAPTQNIPLPAFISPLDLDRRRTPVFTPPVFASTPPQHDYFSLSTSPAAPAPASPGDTFVPYSPSEASSAGSRVGTPNTGLPEFPFGLSPMAMSMRTQRQRQRDFAHSELVNKPLNDSSLGRGIMLLHEHTWYRLQNGLTAMRFPRGDSAWRANDIGNHINWLRCGAYCHRSQTHNLIAVANIDCLNKLIRDAGGHPITPLPYEPKWDYGGRNEPGFVRKTYVSRHLLPESQP